MIEKILKDVPQHELFEVEKELRNLQEPILERMRKLLKSMEGKENFEGLTSAEAAAKVNAMADEFGFLLIFNSEPVRIQVVNGNLFRLRIIHKPQNPRYKRKVWPPLDVKPRYSSKPEHEEPLMYEI